jgi:hypothetical protein
VKLNIRKKTTVRNREHYITYLFITAVGRARVREYYFIIATAIAKV